MKETIEQVLSLWGITEEHLMQIYPSAWEINRSYVMKVYDNRDQMERNIRISAILADCNVPVAETVCTLTGEEYVEHENRYFHLSKKLQGSNISDSKDNVMSYKMGCAIAQLHRAFRKCEEEIEFWDNSLLEEMSGWIQETLKNDGWQMVSREEYLKAYGSLEQIYDHLPRQLIHRDVHLGNFLFFEGKLSGYIDFDLSQRNIRVFDLCYFLTGLLAEESENAFSVSEWIASIKAVISGYESVSILSAEEREAIPWVMECIEILFVAYFIRVKDSKHARDAYDVLRFIQDCEGRLVKQ